MALSGTIRDLVNAALGTTQGTWGLAGAASGYVAVYGLEITLLLVTIAASIPLIRSAAPRPVQESPVDLGLNLDAGPTGPQPAESQGSSVP
jgi:BCD family chlorophyll transporter-like MFS transporter